MSSAEELLVDDVLAEYRVTRSPYRVARSLGIKPDVVIDIIEANRERLSPRQEQFGGLGRPELVEFTVARKRADASWNNEDPAVAAARAAYEAGTVDMCTGRDGNWLILYAIPRKKPAPRVGYFLPEF